MENAYKLCVSIFFTFSVLSFSHQMEDFDSPSSLPRFIPQPPPFPQPSFLLRSIRKDDFIQLFRAKMWSMLKITDRALKQTEFKIDVNSDEDALIWTEIFGESPNLLGKEVNSTLKHH